MSDATRDFLKVEGIGNDFLLFDRLGYQETELAEELASFALAAPRWCDRKSGVGGDGLLIVCDAGDNRALAKQIVINHDGSRPEMCGNGLRCVAHFVAQRRHSEQFRIETDAGLLDCALLSSSATVEAQVSVNMGPPRDLGRTEPAAGAGRAFVGVSMGNPHAIHFVAEGEDPEALARALGPALEVDGAYPDRSNIEFARLESDGSITLWVWERGCGITQACGTGACATAVAAVWEGHRSTGEWIAVSLPGGDLAIRVPADQALGIEMRGAATQGERSSVSLSPDES
jgi:diaminopimelate epimerase